MKNYKNIYISIGLLILIAGIGWGMYQNILTSKALENAAAELVIKAETIAKLNQDKANLIAENTRLGGTLSETMNQKLQLENQNAQATQQADYYMKLATYDKELLAKYSKVYFLNENYVPSKLADIPTQYVLPAGKERQFLDPALPFLVNLLEDAHAANIDLRVVSSYRSFQDQQSLKTEYTVTYGAGTANSFSADQGYSEHQLGTAVDFGTPAVPGATPSFANTDAYTWLQANAYKYGFILSYPKGNSYYIYEPWHWRFVGKSLAQYLHTNNKNFYDMDQRDIDAYLVSIFDK
jgi:LAS superfamily LD-carboxypeptidase LdcB